MFTLGRMDVLLAMDYGLRRGFALTYGLKELPSPKGLMAYGEGWRPHRTAASWYLWRSLELPPRSRDARPLAERPLSCRRVRGLLNYNSFFLVGGVRPSLGEVNRRHGSKFLARNRGHRFSGDLVVHFWKRSSRCGVSGFPAERHHGHWHW